MLGTSGASALVSVVVGDDDPRMGSDRAVASDPSQFLRWRCTLDDPALEIDFALSAMNDDLLRAQRSKLEAALRAMVALEAGSIANADEKRMVGPYWLRAPARAPKAEIGDEIVATLKRIEEFAARIHKGEIAPPEGGRFKKLVLVVISYSLF